MESLIAKIIRNNESQSILLPKEFQLEGDEVYVYKEGKDVVLSPKQRSWNAFFKRTPLPSEDFMSERIDFVPQTRKDLL